MRIAFSVRRIQTPNTLTSFFALMTESFRTSAHFWIEGCQPAWAKPIPKTGWWDEMFRQVLGVRPSGENLVPEERGWHDTRFGWRHVKEEHQPSRVV